MSNMSDAKQLRPKFQTRRIRIIGVDQRDLAVALIQNMPIDPHRPILVTVGEEPKARSLDQNAAYWAGPLREIAEQAWVEGRQYSAEVLHEYFKNRFLPDENTCDRHELELRVKDPANYRKWDSCPDQNIVCIGSTTQLTKFGFGEFMEQVTAFGAKLGVQFHERG